jgi:hypothetical protein
MGHRMTSRWQTPGNQEHRTISVTRASTIFPGIMYIDVRRSSHLVISSMSDLSRERLPKRARVCDSKTPETCRVAVGRQWLPRYGSSTSMSSAKNTIIYVMV